MSNLTRRQEHILEFIREFHDENRIMPTVREIGAEFGISSPNGVVAHLKSLERKGHIKLIPRTSRGIVLTHKVCPHCGKSI